MASFICSSPERLNQEKLSRRILLLFNSYSKLFIYLFSIFEQESGQKPLDIYQNLPNYQFFRKDFSPLP
jgi:hypothetical protein